MKSLLPNPNVKDENMSKMKSCSRRILRKERPEVALMADNATHMNIITSDSSSDSSSSSSDSSSSSSEDEDEKPVENLKRNLKTTNEIR